MSKPSAEAEELRQKIEAAFAEIEYPGDDYLVEDNSGYHLECNRIAAAFKGKHWKQVPFETLRHNPEGWCFLTPEAYCYYLPAYLIAAVLHYEEADVMPGSIVGSLVRPYDVRDVEHYHRRMLGFTLPQRKAIRSFLEFLKQYHPEQNVLSDVDMALGSL